MKKKICSRDAERAVIGCILLDAESIHKVKNILTCDDFTCHDLKLIYESIESLIEKGSVVDLVTVATDLNNKGLLEDIGGPEVLAQVQNEVPTASHIRQYSKIVKDKANMRQIIGFTKKFSESDNMIEPDDLILQIKEKTMEVQSNSYEHLSGSDGSMYMKDIASDFYEFLCESSEEKRETGLPSFDKAINGGFNSSEFVLFAARPSMGKTALALNICLNMAKAGLSVAFVSLEMSKKQVVRRMMSSDMGIPYENIEQGKMTEEDFRRMGIWIDKEYLNLVFINDCAVSSIDAIESYAEIIVNEKKVKTLFIDYVGLIQGSPDKQRTEDVSNISRRLKLLAMRLDICIIALSQLNRAVESREDKRPRLSDLRDSGSLEQDADRVIMLYREGQYKKSADQRKTEILINKNRHGKLSDFFLNFHGENMIFKERIGSFA